MTNRAFLLGINTLSLTFCENDVELMKDCLGQYGYNIYIPGNTRHYDQTRMIKDLNEWIDTITQNDTIIFYYSGHGISERGQLQLVLNNNQQSSSSKQSFREIYEKIENCMAENKLIILDCCRAASYDKDRPLNLQEPNNSRILTASESYRNGEAKKLDEHDASFLTYFFHKGLTDNCYKLCNESGEIRLNQLREEWLLPKTEEHNKFHSTQVPRPGLWGNTDNNILIGKVNLSHFRRSPEKKDKIKYKLPYRDYPRFIGREKELKELLTYISPNYRQHITVVSGIGGVGKTALVLEVSYLCLEATKYDGIEIPEFDVIIFTSAKKNYLTSEGILPRPIYEATLQDIFRTIADVLDDITILQVHQSQQRSQVYQTLRKQRTLLIVDNFETIDSQERNNVLSFLDNVPEPTQVIITTRDQLIRFSPIRLALLSKEESYQLIEQQAEQKKVKPITNYRKTRIYNRFQGIPVALIYVVGRIAAGHSLLSALLVKSSFNPSELNHNDIARFCFDGSVKELKETDLITYQILMIIAIFRLSPIRAAIAMISGLQSNFQALDNGLARLQQLSFITEEEQQEENQFSSRYTMLSITREYSLEELAKNPDFEKEARQRWLKWYIDWTEQYGQEDWENWDVQYDSLTQEWDNILSVLYWCAAEKEYEKVKQLWRNIDTYVDLNNYWQMRRHWWQWLIRESEKYLDDLTKVQALSEKAWTLILMGNHSSSDATKCLAQAWKLQKNCEINDEIKANIANYIAVHRIIRMKFQKALKWLKLQHRLTKQAELEPRQKTRHLIKVAYYQAETYFRQSNYKKAQKLFQWVKQKGEQIGWERFANYAQNWLADILILDNDLENAEQLLKSGMRIAEINKEVRRIAHYRATYARLEEAKGNLQQTQGNVQQAKNHFRQAINYAQQAFEYLYKTEFSNTKGMEEEARKMNFLIEGCQKFLDNNS